MNFIQTRHFAEALQALSGVPAAERDANWYALSAMANSGAGNRVQALADARRAAEMDPTNPDFQRLLHQLESGGDAYATYSAGYPNSGFGTGSWCADMCLLNLCAIRAFRPAAEKIANEHPGGTVCVLPGCFALMCRGRCAGTGR